MLYISIIYLYIHIKASTKASTNGARGKLKNTHPTELMKNKITYALTYKGWPINTVKSRSLGAYTAILNSIHSQISALLSHHSRITVLVFQLHVPYMKFSGSRTWNQEVSEFVQEAKRKLATTAWGNHRQLAYCWVREVGDSRKEHYHVYIAFKQLYRRAGKVSAEGYTGLWGMLQKPWEELTGGFLRPITSHTVNRNNQSEIFAAFRHLSYLAKVRDKDFGTGENHKRYSSSRLLSKDGNKKYWTSLRSSPPDEGSTITVPVAPPAVDFPAEWISVSQTPSAVDHQGLRTIVHL
ncbi:inovirus-type Gp2 protein [Pseudomonas aeruginosa]|uniref:YagK/YfjJ domain-containing protein n=1 Tax=Pseudomonas aeruginosa TaxID=287 RepID=UPI001F4CFA41|nr:inovirus-type Gp2 protein [Pseudomonas aeruginosa]MCO2549223.1 inovirus Gp2 family protein [Pseudomonas aeruginosa]UTN34322.1 inovirus Gp2 family protein [Pseudomonas aeruginosa]WCY34996.1 inovirus-type Gp2 protein [Pseudomonas aeruginosa]WCY40907.1 inovirus-type Gp2 protein [Pseudomonas aeruginosa]